MADTGALFYDNREVFANYQERRSQSTSANSTLELPIMRELLPPISALDIADLGCGDGVIGQELLAAGAQSYWGIDGSSNMVKLTQALHSSQFRVEQDFIESWQAEAESLDLVLSRLAFHYIESLTPVFERIYSALRPGGHFIFSVEHPVITSHQLSMKQGANRQDWIVDRYFVPGKREVSWMGGKVLKYHRTVEHYFQALLQCGFQVLNLRESEPQAQHFQDKKLLEKRQRVPLFLFLKALKT